MFDRGWTDGLPVVPPTEERVLRMLEGTTRDARRDRRRRAARPRRGHRREGRHQRGDGRLQARVPAVGARRVEAVVHRRVQHPRRAGHDDAGRPGDHLQRPGHAGDRHELRRSTRSARATGPTRRSGGRCSSSSATSAAAARARSTGPTHGNPGKLSLLLRRGRGRLAVDAAGRQPRRRAEAPTPSRCSPARGRAASSTSCRATPRVAGHVVRRLPAHRAPPEARRSASTRSSSSDPSTPGCSPRPAGTASSVLATSCTPPAAPRQRDRPRRRRHRRGRARARFADATLPKFRPGGLLLVHAGGGAGLFSAIIARLGQRRHRQPAGHTRSRDEVA